MPRSVRGTRSRRQKSRKMLRVVVNRDSCQGFANCVLVAEDLFELDEHGVAVAKRELVPDDRVEDVRMAQYECPTDAISIVEDEAGAARG